MGSAKALVICQTYLVHGQIADMLAKLRTVAKKTPEAGPPVRDKDTGQYGTGSMTLSSGVAKGHGKTGMRGDKDAGQHKSCAGEQTPPGNASKGQGTKKH